MKKLMIIPSVLVLLLMFSVAAHGNQGYYQPDEESKEELMMDLFLSLLLPHIDQPVTDYYSTYLNDHPLVYPYQIKIIYMERTNGYRGFSFLVTIEITPVVGPHIPVGKDQLTFSITPSEVIFKKFKHIETYELPPNWQHIKKKTNRDDGLDVY